MIQGFFNRSPVFSPLFIKEKDGVVILLFYRLPSFFSVFPTTSCDLSQGLPVLQFRSFFASYQTTSLLLGRRLTRLKVYLLFPSVALCRIEGLCRLSQGLKKGLCLSNKYLGCFLFRGRKKKVHFQHIIDSVNKRLSGWAGKMLSPGGRLVLIKHVLYSIPLHVLAAMEPPKAVLDHIEKRFSNLLWGKISYTFLDAG